jgi:hypothetical protein
MNSRTANGALGCVGASNRGANPSDGGGPSTQQVSGLHVHSLCRRMVVAHYSAPTAK